MEFLADFCVNKLKRKLIHVMKKKLYALLPNSTGVEVQGSHRNTQAQYKHREILLNQYLYLKYFLLDQSYTTHELGIGRYAVAVFMNFAQVSYR